MPFCTYEIVKGLEYNSHGCLKINVDAGAMGTGLGRGATYLASYRKS